MLIILKEGLEVIKNFDFISSYTIKDYLISPAEYFADCFMFYYDASISTYFWVSTSCGGATASSVLAYKNNFTTKDNLAYVYVNYGIIDPVDTTSANIYKDLEKVSIYQGNVAFLEANNFRIDASNYQNFSQYKFTFNKDSNNNYYFTKLEKVN